MADLLVLSNSVSPGMGFLEHARTVIGGLVPPGSRLPGADVSDLLTASPRFDVRG